MSEQRLPFSERVARALQDEQMRQAVPLTQDRFRSSRLKALAELGNAEEWRQRASEIRWHTLENLDSYLEQLAAQVRKNGGHVHFAPSADDAVAYIKRVAQEHGARSVVKSKSMVTEEIHLNRHLEEAGVRVVESDLGEYIIQLAGESPSHLIAPAIHKTRGEVARLFSAVAGRPLSDETRELTRFAREVLRQEFLTADIGVTGCNFAVAESGTVVLVSNEGNARLTTTLPRVHIAVMGMERVVPSWNELDVLLTMLIRSATGQRLSVYVTAISGPRRPEDADGPEEFHLVILDNGRSSILGTAYQEVLKCIRCGACLNVCPVYRQVGGHAYGSVYSGPIGAVLTPLLKGYEEAGELPYASSLCAACTEVCPVKIPLHDLLIQHRKDEVEAGRAPWAEQAAMKAFGWLVGRPQAFTAAAKLARAGMGLFDDDGFLTMTGGPLAGWTSSRDLPLPARESFRQWWQRERGTKTDE